MSASAPIPRGSAVPAGSPPPTTRPEPTPRAILRTVLIVLCVVFALYLIYQLRKPISWLVIATFLAIALSGPVNLLSRNMPRGLAILIAYLTLILVPIGVAALIIPPLVNELTDLAKNVPKYVARRAGLAHEQPDAEEARRPVRHRRETAAEGGGAADAPRRRRLDAVERRQHDRRLAVRGVQHLRAVDLHGRRRAHAGSTAASTSRAPSTRRASDARVDRIAIAVGNYVGGALFQATIAGITTFLVLTILGVPFAAPLSAIVFVFDLIPLVGATLAAIVVGLVTVFNDFPVDTIIWVIWAIVYQQIENNVIQPQIQKRAVEIHPFMVLVSVLFGATLFGIVGALLAIPFAASLQIAAREWWDYRQAVRRSRCRRGWTCRSRPSRTRRAAGAAGSAAGRRTSLRRSGYEGERSRARRRRSATSAAVRGRQRPGDGGVRLACCLPGALADRLERRLAFARPPTARDAARRRRDGAEALIVEEAGEVLRPAALRSETGYQEDGIRHQRPQRRSLLGVGEARDGADVCVAPFADALRSERVDHPRDALVDAVLHLSRRRVARPHEHEQALPEASRDVDHRLQRFRAEVGADGDRIGVVDRQLDVLADPHAPQRGGRIRGHRVADVAALGVLDHEQTGGAGVLLDALQRGDARRAERLEEGRLRLDGRDQLGDAVDHRASRTPPPPSPRRRGR